MIDLYTAPTPNGYKVSIMLEETGLPYNAIKIDLNAGDQKKPEFLKVNPNGKIPVIVDHEASVTLSESGAILIYLAEKSGKFLPSEPASRHKTIQWLFFQMASIGPMIGQLWHFIELDPPVHYATKRYRNEAERICKVVDTQLGETVVFVSVQKSPFPLDYVHYAERESKWPSQGCVLCWIYLWPDF